MHYLYQFTIFSTISSLNYCVALKWNVSNDNGNSNHKNS